MVARTRAVFGLLVETVGGSRRRAARWVHRDLRSLTDMRALPSIGVLRDIGMALGWSASTTAEVVARMGHFDVGGSVGAGADATDRITELAQADEQDDAATLERLAFVIVADAGQAPALRALVHARALASRGDSHGALLVLRAIERFPAAQRHMGHALAAMHARTARDAADGVPWRIFTNADIVQDPGEASRALDSIADAVARSVLDRSSFASSSTESSPTASPSSSLCFVRQPQAAVARVAASGAAPPGEGRVMRALDRCTQAAQAHAAWAISSVGLRAYGTACSGITGRRRASAVQVGARASLMLADLEEQAGPELAGLMQSRRSRLLLRETALRIGADGVHAIRLDAEDARELMQACARFPKCLSLRDMRVLFARARAVIGPRPQRSKDEIGIECHLTRRKLAFDCTTVAAPAPSCAVTAARSEVTC